MSESDLDIFKPPQDDGVTDTPLTPATSMVGFVGVSAGFGVLVGLCAAVVTCLWVALFGRWFFTTVGVALGWIAGGVFAPHG
ncbi:hypothetical protein GCM10028798_02540 [Humibacter antri]